MLVLKPLLRSPWMALLAGLLLTALLYALALRLVPHGAGGA
jgi:hypothetical protein